MSNNKFNFDSVKFLFNDELIENDLKILDGVSEIRKIENIENIENDLKILDEKVEKNKPQEQENNIENEIIKMLNDIKLEVDN